MRTRGWRTRVGTAQHSESSEGILGSCQGLGQRGSLPAPLPALCWGGGSGKGENRVFNSSL